MRQQRFQGLVSDLLRKVRRLNPMLPDDQVLEMAESMAELRLLDKELGNSALGPMYGTPRWTERGGEGRIALPSRSPAASGLK